MNYSNGTLLEGAEKFARRSYRFPGTKTPLRSSSRVQIVPNQHSLAPGLTKALGLPRVWGDSGHFPGR